LSLVSVSFIKLADVTGTVAIDAPTEGDTKATATASLTNVNNEQLTSSKLRVAFSYGDGSTFPTYTQAAVAAWDADDKFVADSGTFGSSGSLTKDKALSAKLQFSADSSTNWTDVASSSAVVTARKVATATADVVKSATATSNGSSTYSVNRNKEFQVKLTVKDNASTPAAVAGVPVKVSVTTGTAQSNSIALGTGASDKKVTVNGVQYTDKTKLPGIATTGAAKVAVTTDASGVATVTLKTDNFAVGDHVSVKFEYENSSRTLDVVSVNPTFSLYVLNGGTQSILAKGTASLNVAVYDQFGGVPADGSDVRAIYASSTGRTGTGEADATAASNVNVPLVAGKATVGITDNGAGDGTSTYNISVETRAAGGGYESTPVVAAAGYDLQILSAARAAGDITLTAGAAFDATTKVYARSGTLSPKDNGNYDERSVLGSAPEHTGYVALDGNVKTAATATAAQANVMGAPVTLSGAGLQFKTTVSGKTVYAADSITVYTDASGNYLAEVASNKAGKQTVTITSGSATRTVEVTFTDAAADSGTNVVIDAPASVLPGSTLVVTVTLTDKYGNPVNTENGSSAADLVVSYTGPGLVVGTSVGTITDETNASGKISFTVLLGTNDGGKTATINTRYRKTGANQTTDKQDAKTVVIGAAEVKVAAFTKRVGETVKVVSQGSAKVEFRINGKKVASRSTLGTLNRTFDLVDGKNVVEIYVAGKRVKRVAYTK
jgi:hypothetical protein